MSGNLMYPVGKYIELPKNITLPTSMFPMKSMYNLQGDLSQAYYGSDQVSADIKRNDQISLADVEARQSRILEKLKEFKNKLDNLAQKSDSSSCRNVYRNDNSNIMSPEKRKLELASIIGKVQSQLVTIDQKDYSNLEEAKVVSQKQEIILDELYALRKAITSVCSESIELEPAQTASIDIESQQLGIISVIEALQELLVNEVALFQKTAKEGEDSDIDKHHNEIVKLIHKLQSQLETIKNSIASRPVEVEASGQDVVISCPANRTPYSILLLKDALVKYGLKVYSTCATHSSIKGDVPYSVQFNEDEGKSRLGSDLFFTLHWKDQDDVSLMVNPLKQWIIKGEGNVIRYISRLFPAGCPFNYESGDLIRTAATDLLLDDVQFKLVFGKQKERMKFIEMMNARLGKSNFLVGDEVGVGDIFAASALLQLSLENSVPSNVKSWFSRLNLQCIKRST